MKRDLAGQEPERWERAVLLRALTCHSPYNLLDLQTLSALLHSGLRWSYHSGEQIRRTREWPHLLLLSGRVELSPTEAREIERNAADQPQLLGLNAWLSQQQKSPSAQPLIAHSPVEVIHLSPQRLAPRTLGGRHERFWRKLAETRFQALAACRPDLGLTDITARRSWCDRASWGEVSLSDQAHFELKEPGCWFLYEGTVYLQRPFAARLSAPILIPSPWGLSGHALEPCRWLRGGSLPPSRRKSDL